MAKPIQLLLLKTIENLGIVGDIVKVKPGYARNYLVPHGFAEPPTKVKIEALKEERARAESELNILRKQRVALLERMMTMRISGQRSPKSRRRLNSPNRKMTPTVMRTAGPMRLRVPQR